MNKSANVYCIDLFCGAGGTTTSISKVKGMEIIWCINHDSGAILSHSMNHPNCQHSIEDIRTFDISPLVALVRKLRAEDPNCVILLHASLECTNFSKAKCGPKEADSRTLANDLFRYLDALDVDIMTIENVEEFLQWGPLDEYGMPDKEKLGEFYDQWVEVLTTKYFSEVYAEDILVSADFGGRTIRKRLFLQFAKNPNHIGVPEPTHEKSEWLPVRDIIDQENHGKSVFYRKKSLAANTMRRIFKGLEKFGPKEGTHFGIKYYGQDGWQNMEDPSGTLTTKDRIYPVFIKIDHGKSIGRSLEEPFGTLTKNPKGDVIYTKRNAFLHNPQYGGSNRSLDKPAGTIIARQDKAPMGLTESFQHNEEKKFLHMSNRPNDGKHPIRYQNGRVEYIVFTDDNEWMVKVKRFCYDNNILDILMRSLTVEEMLQIQGFPRNYKLVGTKTNQKKWIGNSVEVKVGAAFFLSIYNAINDTYDDTVEEIVPTVAG